MDALPIIRAAISGASSAPCPLCGEQRSLRVRIDADGAIRLRPTCRAGCGPYSVAAALGLADVAHVVSPCPIGWEARP